MAHWSPHLHRHPPPALITLSCVLGFCALLIVVINLVNVGDIRILARMSTIGRLQAGFVVALFTMGLVIWGTVLIFLAMGFRWAKYAVIGLCVIALLALLPVENQGLAAATLVARTPFLGMNAIISLLMMLFVGSREMLAAAESLLFGGQIAFPVLTICMFFIPPIRMFYRAKSEFARMQKESEQYKIGRFK